MKCVTCGNEYQPTGTNNKYCIECRCKAKSQYGYNYSVKSGRIKNPGVGSGHAQGIGSTHHSWKPGAFYHYRIKLKKLCERCGSKKFLCGHHHDYSKPDEVETLCKSCHQRVHKCYENFPKPDAALRAKLSANLVNLNKTSLRINGRNTRKVS